jgi:hypothetical protein
MTLEKIALTVERAKVLIALAEAVEWRVARNKLAIMGCKETGALRRASLDLTRALADMRRPG